MRPELLETTYIANARRLAGAMLGVADEDVRFGGLMLIHKPAGGGRDTPWHQDEAYWDLPPTLKSHALSVWMRSTTSPSKAAACSSCLARTS
jgi:hypothetical protein